MIVRPATLADAAAIGDLEVDVWRDPISGLAGDIPSAHIDICNTIRFGWAFVVDADCACGRLRCERDGLRACLLATATRDGDVLVADLCVREDCRRMGLGRALLERLAEEAGFARALVALVDTENAASLALCEAAGFRRVAQIADPYCYGGGDVAWKLRRNPR